MTMDKKGINVRNIEVITYNAEPVYAYDEYSDDELQALIDNAYSVDEIASDNDDYADALAMLGYDADATGIKVYRIKQQDCNGNYMNGQDALISVTE